MVQLPLLIGITPRQLPESLLLKYSESGIIILGDVGDLF